MNTFQPLTYKGRLHVHVQTISVKFTLTNKYM